MIKLLWWLWHFPWRCGRHIVREVGAWNPDYPEHITPRYKCYKCGRQYVKGEVYPIRPISPPPDPLNAPLRSFSDRMAKTPIEKE